MLLDEVNRVARLILVDLERGPEQRHVDRDVVAMRHQRTHVLGQATAAESATRLEEAGNGRQSLGIAAADALQIERQRDVFPGRQRWDQMMGLEDKSKKTEPQVSACLFGQRSDLKGIRGCPAALMLIPRN